MANGRDIVRWAGVLLIVGGGLLGVYGLVLTAYAPLSAAWWGFNFNVFWGGIAALIVGLAAVFTGQYLMEEPYEQRKVEIPA